MSSIIFSTIVLPSEIWSLISQKLPDVRSIINLSLTCKAIGNPILSDLKYILKKNLNLDLYQIFKKAIKENKIEIVSYLVHYTDMSAYTSKALCYASRNNYTDVVKLLLKYGADATARDNFSLRYASENGHLEVVRLLLKYGADATTRDNFSLRTACKNKHFDIVNLLLENGANPKEYNRWFYEKFCYPGFYTM